MNWLIFLFSILKPLLFNEGSTMNPVQEIKDLVRANAIKMTAIFAALSSLASIFSGGIVMIAFDMGAQYDQNGYLYFSSMIISGMILSLTSLGVLMVAFRIFNVSKTFKREENQPLKNVGTTHPLQDALALLVLDFVKERELKRTHFESKNASQHEEMTH